MGKGEELSLVKPDFESTDPKILRPDEVLTKRAVSLPLLHYCILLLFFLKKGSFIISTEILWIYWGQRCQSPALPWRATLDFSHAWTVVRTDGQRQTPCILLYAFGALCLILYNTLLETSTPSYMLLTYYNRLRPCLCPLLSPILSEHSLKYKIWHIVHL